MAQGVVPFGSWAEMTNDEQKSSPHRQRSTSANCETLAANSALLGSEKLFEFKG